MNKVYCYCYLSVPGQKYLRGLVPLKEGFDMESLVVMPIDVQGELWHICIQLGITFVAVILMLDENSKKDDKNTHL